MADVASSGPERSQRKENKKEVKYCLHQLSKVLFLVKSSPTPNGFFVNK